VLSTNFGKKLQLYTMYYPGRAQILIQVPWNVTNMVK
jgi:hypothetical protein